jgi:hypothetical protein
MNTNLSGIVDRIRSRYPHLDVRTDQCDIVRVLAKQARVIVGIEEKNGTFRATFSSMDSKLDFEDDILNVLSSTDATRFGEDVVASLGKL